MDGTRVVATDGGVPRDDVPEPVEADGEVIAYECPDCGTLKTGKEAAAGHCQDDPEPESVDLEAVPETESGEFPAAMQGWGSWMPWADWDRKQPVAKYSAAANPHSWSDPGNWTDFETADRWASMDPSLAGNGFILQKAEDPYSDGGADPFFVVDYDDARDPDTGELHPVVRDHAEWAGIYADVSTSGTGVHLIGCGELPEGVKAVDAELPANEQFPDAGIEVYDGKRFLAMTGEHIVGTPDDALDAQAFLDDVVEEFATVPDSKPDAMDFEPEKSRAEIVDVETTDDIQDVFDAIRHTRPADIRLKSTVTEERADGSKDMDPSWASSDSGTRLAQVGDGWVYRKGMRGLDALQVVALEERIITHEGDYPSGDDFQDAVDALRDRGAHIPELEGSGESQPVSALPLAQLDALNPQERRRAAKKRGLEWPSTEGARERLFQRVTEVMRHKDSRVIDAPTSLGKSHTIAATPWDSPQYEDVTGEKQIVHLSKTRDARDEAVSIARRHGDGCFVLLGRHEACPVAGGEFDPDKCHKTDREPITVDGEPVSDWITAQCEGKGMPFSVVHTKLKERKDQDGELPCCEEGQRCEAIAQWEDLREGDHTLIEATHNFARVPGLRMHTNIVFDEEPDFGQDFTTDRVRRMITALLKELDAPVTNWESFITLCRNRGGGDAAAEADQLAHILDDPSIDQDWYFEEPDAHTLAPALARAIYYGEDRGNGRWGATTSHEPPRLDAGASEDDSWNREWIRVVLDEDNQVCTVRCSPDLNLARSVIGLDAHPSMPKWRVNTKPDIHKREVLEPTERQLWRRYERGLRVVQVGEATRPFASGDYFNGNGTQAILEHLREEYGSDFRTVITASSVEDQTQDLMVDAGVSDPETMHYGEEKSRNDFADEGVGLVNGSIDPGDEFVVNLLAELDLDAEPEIATDKDGEEYRAHGRGFVGDDADTAAEILASVRENHVAQAAGRYARNPDDPSSTATVFVRTDAMPVAFADVQVPGVEWLFTDKQREIVENVRDRSDGVTAKGVAEDVGVSKEHVRQTLRRLTHPDDDQSSSVHAVEMGGENGATLYRDVGLPDSGVVDLGDQPPTIPLGESYTWSLAVHPPTQQRSTVNKETGPNTSSESNVWWLDDHPSRRSDPEVGGGGGD